MRITPAKTFVFQGSFIVNTQYSDESVKVIFSMQIRATMFCQRRMLEECVRPNLENVNSQVVENPVEAQYCGAAIRCMTETVPSSRHSHVWPYVHQTARISWYGFVCFTSDSSSLSLNMNQKWYMSCNSLYFITHNHAYLTIREESIKLNMGSTYIYGHTRIIILWNFCFLSGFSTGCLSQLFCRNLIRFCFSYNAKTRKSTK